VNIDVSPFLKEDIKQITKLHKAAFKGYMNASLGNRYVREFLNWFLNYPGTITLKAVVDGKISGYVVGAPIGYDKEMNRQLFSTALMGIVTHPHILLHESFSNAAVAKLKMLLGKKPVKRIVRSPEGKGISLVGIAVDPSFSGKGIGKAIMKAFEEKARAMHMDYMRLSVYKDNMLARAVYEKSGWEILEPQGKILYYYKMLTTI